MGNRVTSPAILWLQNNRCKASASGHRCSAWKMIAWWPMVEELVVNIFHHLPIWRSWSIWIHYSWLRATTNDHHAVPFSLTCTSVNCHDCTASCYLEMILRKCAASQWGRARQGSLGHDHGGSCLESYQQGYAYGITCVVLSSLMYVGNGDVW